MTRAPYCMCNVVDGELLSSSPTAEPVEGSHRARPPLALEDREPVKRWSETAMDAGQRAVKKKVVLPSAPQGQLWEAPTGH